MIKTMQSDLFLHNDIKVWKLNMTYQKTLKLLGLSDVNPAVFFNDFDVFYFIIESAKQNTENKLFDCY